MILFTGIRGASDAGPCEGSDPPHLPMWYPLERDICFFGVSNLIFALIISLIHLASLSTTSLPMAYLTSVEAGDDFLDGFDASTAAEPMSETDWKEIDDWVVDPEEDKFGVLCSEASLESLQQAAQEARCDTAGRSSPVIQQLDSTVREIEATDASVIPAEVDSGNTHAPQPPAEDELTAPQPRSNESVSMMQPRDDEGAVVGETLSHDVGGGRAAAAAAQEVSEAMPELHSAAMQHEIEVPQGGLATIAAAETETAAAPEALSLTIGDGRVADGDFAEFSPPPNASTAGGGLGWGGSWGSTAAATSSWGLGAIGKLAAGERMRGRASVFTVMTSVR